MGSQDASFEQSGYRQLGLKIRTTSYHRHSAEFGRCGAKMPLLKKEAQNHRITESQNGRGWKGPLWVI